eukprot:TRINITY_DN6417_c0_g1_i1.p1 TRINITY_DN6417_c0_g1~~TRINITY_DN6417_c0_g1_i1.p1  ORF type:complete len:462 (-),score=48.48 TRINITY_DN6417_c0_g1_i1:149-1534(-)
MDNDTWQKCVKVVKHLMRKEEARIYFNNPVDQKMYPDYVTIIKRPIDLGTINSNLSNKLYSSVQELKTDIAQVWKNCRTYNEPGSDVYGSAQNMEKFTSFIYKQVGFDKVCPPTPSQPLETSPKKVLHPLHRCLKLLEELPPLPAARPFRKPVDGALYTDYYDVIKHPMCLKDIISELKPAERTGHWDSLRYRNQYEVQRDIELMFQNCRLYNPSGEPILQQCEHLEQEYRRRWDLYELSETSRKAEQVQEHDREPVISPDQSQKSSKKIKLTIQSQGKQTKSQTGSSYHSHHKGQSSSKAGGGTDMPSLADLFKPPSSSQKKLDEKERKDKEKMARLHDLQNQKADLEKQAEELEKQAKDLKRQMRDLNNKRQRQEDEVQKLGEQLDVAKKQLEENNDIMAKVLELEAIRNAPVKDEDLEPFHINQKIFLSEDSNFNVHFKREQETILDKHAQTIKALFT